MAGTIQAQRRLVTGAEPAKLGFDADIARLAGLDPLDYERERVAAAARHGVRVAFIDAAVKAARPEAEAAAAEEDEDEGPHPEPVADLAEVLDAALVEMRRYVAALNIPLRRRWFGQRTHTSAS